ncbi:MAG TPA: Rpn family recombination-promoting nuclease/putative transposase [Blastocatellia bacterium]|nr:Rpn family recombination-promoting nuclease/putative transposase [Blastocatellia bacterium]
MSEINNPHDHFVKGVLSQLDVASDFLSNYLPENIVALLDTKKIELIQNSFIDSELREVQSDLLFQVERKDRAAAYIYVLFEHKSYPDRWVGLQLLRYMTRIWDRYVGQGKGQPLPLIVPLVLYHGESHWNVALEFAALFGQRDNVSEAYVPRFEYVLVDLSKYDDARIIGEAKLRVTLLLLKYIFSARLGPRLADILKLYPLPGQKGLEYLQTVLRYLSAASDKLDENDLRKALKKAYLERGEGIMPTLAEKWIKEGVDKGLQLGMQQGMQQGLLSLTLRQLKLRFGSMDPIAEQQIRSLSVEQLSELGEALLEFHSPADLTDWLRNQSKPTD